MITKQMMIWAAAMAFGSLLVVAERSMGRTETPLQEPSARAELLEQELNAWRLVATEAVARLDEQERVSNRRHAPGSVVGFYGTRLETYGGELAPGVVGNLAYDATPGGGADHLFCAARGPDGTIVSIRYAGRPLDTGYPPCPKP